jgi:hypothetical protein
MKIIMVRSTELHPWDQQHQAARLDDMFIGMLIPAIVSQQKTPKGANYLQNEQGYFEVRIEDGYVNSALGAIAKSGMDFASELANAA